MRGGYKEAKPLPTRRRWPRSTKKSKTPTYARSGQERYTSSPRTDTRLHPLRDSHSEGRLPPPRLIHYRWIGEKRQVPPFIAGCVDQSCGHSNHARRSGWRPTTVSKRVTASPAQPTTAKARVDDQFEDYENKRMRSYETDDEIEPFEEKRMRTNETDEGEDNEGT